jgi:hypothetical protein
MESEYSLDAAMIPELNALLSPEEQQHWLSDVNFQIPEETGFQPDPSDEALKAGWLKLGTLPKSKQLAEILTLYLQTCLPAPQKTAGIFWSCVVLPENPDQRNSIYVRLYAGSVEVLTVYLDPMRNTLNFSFHTAKSALEGRNFLQKFQHRFRFTAMRITEHRYEKGGEDQHHFALSNVGETRRLLKEKAFLTAIRTFNLRLMQQEKASHREEHNGWLVKQLLSD